MTKTVKEKSFPYPLIGEELRRALKALKVAQNTLARNSGMSNTTVGNVLKGGI